MGIGPSIDSGTVVKKKMQGFEADGLIWMFMRVECQSKVTEAFPPWTLYLDNSIRV